MRHFLVKKKTFANAIFKSNVGLFPPQILDFVPLSTSIEDIHKSRRVDIDSLIQSHA